MRPHLLPAFLALSLLPGSSAHADSCASCTVEVEATLLCAAHADLERATLAEQVEHLRAEDIERATAALEAIAALTAAHDNAPSPRVAEALARGLEHDAPEVRRVSVRLLGSGQHEPSARAALLQASRDFPREASARRKAFEREQARLAKRAAGRDDTDTTDVEALRKSLEEMSRDAEDMAAAAVAQSEFSEYGIELAEALAQGDDAALDALLKMADALEDVGHVHERLVRALVARARADAVARAVELLGSWQDDRKAAEKELSKLERERELAEKRAGDDPRKRLALAAESTALQRQRSRVEAYEERGRALHAALAEMASARGLGAAPEWNDEPHDAWRAWYNRNRGDLPRRLDAATGGDE